MNYQFGNHNSSQWNNQRNNSFDERFWVDNPVPNWNNNYHQNYNQYQYPNSTYYPNYYSGPSYQNDNFNQYDYQRPNPNNPKNKSYFKKNKLVKINNIKKRKTNFKACNSDISPHPGSEEDRRRMIENSKALVTEKLKNLNKEDISEIQSSDEDTEDNEGKSKKINVVCVNDSLNDLKLNINDLKEIGRIGCPQVTISDEEKSPEGNKECVQITISDNEEQDTPSNKRKSPSRSPKISKRTLDILNSPRNEIASSSPDMRILSSSPKNDDSNSLPKVLSYFNSPSSLKRDNKQSISPRLVKRRKRNSCDQEGVELPKKSDENIQRNDAPLLDLGNRFLRDIINNPGPGRINFELQKLIKSKRLQLTREMRKVAEERIQNLLRKQDNPILSHIADSLLDDPDMAINLNNLPQEVISEITSILGIDLNECFEEEQLTNDINLNNESLIKNDEELNRLLEVQSSEMNKNTIENLNSNNLKRNSNSTKIIDDNLKLNENNHLNTNKEGHEILNKEDHQNPNEHNLREIHLNLENNLKDHIQENKKVNLNTFIKDNSCPIQIKKELIEFNDNSKIDDSCDINLSTHNHSYSDSFTQTNCNFQDSCTQTLSKEESPSETHSFYKRMEILESQNNELKLLVLSLKEDFFKLKTSLEMALKNKSDIIDNSGKSKITEETRIVGTPIPPEEMQKEPGNSLLNEKKKFKGPRGSINEIQTFTHPSLRQLILAASEDGFIYLFSWRKGTIIKKFGKDSGSVTSIFLTFNAKQPMKLFSGSNDSFFRVFDYDTEEEISKINLNAPIQCLEKCWGSIYIGNSSGEVHKFNIKTCKNEESFIFSKNPIFCLTATKEGPRKVLIVGARQEPISVRDANTGLLLRTFKSENITVYKIIIDRNLVYCGTNKKNIFVYQFQNGEQSFDLPSGAGIICLKNYKNVLFAGGYDGNIYSFSLKTRELLSTVKCTDKMVLSLEIWQNKIIFGDKIGQIKIINFPEEVQKYLKNS